MSSPDFAHEPVMASEVLEALSPMPAGVHVDATLGGAGHARAILSERPDVTLVGFDRDDAALQAATDRLAADAERVTLVHGGFDELDERLDDAGVDRISGFLFDLGVSSHQLDTPDRGFSYRNEGPLDMRMDRDQELSADAVVNTYPARDIERILRDHADERFARRIAAAIVAGRPVTTTTQLSDLVRDAIPAAARRKGGHPAKRTFQAVRIEVNAELAILGASLDAAIGRLAPGGRGVVLAYHSGEDRIVKHRFRQAETGGCTCPPDLPCGCGAVPLVRLVGRGSTKASAAEQQRNPRAASVRMRVLERIAS